MDFALYVGNIFSIKYDVEYDVVMISRFGDFHFSNDPLLCTNVENLYSALEKLEEIIPDICLRNITNTFVSDIASYQCSLWTIQHVKDKGILLNMIAEDKQNIIAITDLQHFYNFLKRVVVDIEERFDPEYSEMQ